MASVGTTLALFCVQIPIEKKWKFNKKQSSFCYLDKWKTSRSATLKSVFNDAGANKTRWHKWVLLETDARKLLRSNVATAVCTGTSRGTLVHFRQHFDRPEIRAGFCWGRFQNDVTYVISCKLNLDFSVEPIAFMYACKCKCLWVKFTEILLSKVVSTKFFSLLSVKNCLSYHETVSDYFVRSQWNCLWYACVISRFHTASSQTYHKWEN